ncbi:hypothetical protein PVK06_031079 [Gossypium arboreum]|uniref:Uncharacterized protein n=1 Tax=Gossypium arboreum TaxID=29729 RepID=A0ABR0NQM4_GOSAR|nr:hypothetical protein PVK06_031079 [Gossypium arboreum]
MLSTLEGEVTNLKEFVVDEFEATMSALDEQIEKFNEELVICRVFVGKEVLGVTPNHQMNVPKSENFKVNQCSM